jgi:hypothetical protein
MYTLRPQQMGKLDLIKACDEKEVSLNQIVNQNKTLDSDKVLKTMQDLKENGQTEPIRVRRLHDGKYLVRVRDDAHSYEAAKRLGWKSVRVRDYQPWLWSHNRNKDPNGTKITDLEPNAFSIKYNKEETPLFNGSVHRLGLACPNCAYHRDFSEFWLENIMEIIYLNPDPKNERQTPLESKMAIVVSECPNCHQASFSHYRFRSLLLVKGVEQQKLEAISTGSVGGFL